MGLSYRNGNSLRAEFSSGKSSAEVVKLRPTEPVPPLQHLEKDFDELCLEEAQEGGRERQLT